MSIVLDVGLHSGKIATVEARFDEGVETLKGLQFEERRFTDIQSKRGAFAAVRENGSAVTIVTCGAADCSGDSRVAQDQGMNVQQIQANDRAFAAVLGDGLVVTWGDAAGSGDDSETSFVSEADFVRSLLKEGYCFSEAEAAELFKSFDPWGPPT
ncbi:hypothetical protein AK812_SmicGene19800 [Symbiodinium microadriaticum]|uniref:Uncharacterized protein n=1 Tax=Symbiodinium microadriaticum TaxID=2951 RepID=A0A1Q9DRM9_SYMMI|nr:hypothetical protein AK812_SmicGene19800 [Symbiodinium microadriaticum]